MKKASIYTVLLLLYALVPGGCIAEDRSDCPDDNGPRLVLNFEYFDSTEDEADAVWSEIFADSIHTVDVLVFDRNLFLYTYVPLEQEVKETRRVEIPVEPGEYYIVCWGNNLSRRTDVAGTAGFEDFQLDLDNTTTIDPVYYAPDIRRQDVAGGRAPKSRSEDLEPYRVEVAPVGTTEHTMSFMSAHRILEVTLVNFPDVVEETHTNPTISVTRQVSSYDIELGRGEENMTLLRQARSQTDSDDRKLGYASYYIPHFDNDNPIQIAINGTDYGAPYEHTVPMTRVLEELYPEWIMYDGDNRTLKVEIDWNDGVHLKLRIASWEVKHIDPGFS
ncbi:MAG: FimB/Mfa2 family fimbrial subunit [Alistipes sp.]|nr:FimB/Mfa2 family fimbrial subunit [Alistipes sp.]